MKNLGKITIFLLLITNMLYADVRATVDETNVELGDVVTYSLHLSGGDIKQPQIDTLCGNDVTSTSTQTSINMVNGNYSKTKTFSYEFMPQKSCTIEPIEVEIDGKIQKTNPVEIKVTKSASSVDADFILKLSSSKKEVFVGEPFDVSLILKQRVDAEALDSKFQAPSFKGFWIKAQSQPTKKQDDKYVYTKLSYTLAPQRVGDLNISQAKLQIAKRDHSRDSWGSWIPNVKWKTYFSNTLSIKAKPLPEGVTLVGHFNISATVTKKEVSQNEALNLTLEVLGDGNLEDIKSFKPYIDGVNVFDEKIVVKNHKLTQKMAFVADRDFTIPPFKLRFFNPQTKQIETISTNPIHIKVKNSKVKDEPLVVKKESKTEQKDKTVVVKESFSSLYGALLYIFGLVSGIVLMVFKPWNRYQQKEKKVSIKEPRKLLIKLLPFKNDKEVEEIMDILEKNIYHDSDIKVDKKVLKEIFKRYNIN